MGSAIFVSLDACSLRYKMPKQSKCCCCFPLKIGGYILAFMEFVEIVYSFFTYTYKNPNNESLETVWSRRSFNVITFLTVTDAISVGNVLLFLYALSRDNKGCMFVSFFWTCIHSIIRLVFLIYQVLNFFGLADAEGMSFPHNLQGGTLDRNGLAFVYTVEAVMTVVHVYWLKVKYDLYLEMAKKEGRVREGESSRGLSSCCPCCQNSEDPVLPA